MPKVKIITHKPIGEARQYKNKVKEMTPEKVKEFFEKNEIKNTVLREIYKKEINAAKVEKGKAKNG